MQTLGDVSTNTLTNLRSLLESKRLTRNIEREVRHDHIALAGKADEIDRAGIFGRAGIVGGGSAVAHLGGAVPMTERHIIGAGRRDLVVADEPARPQPRAAIGTRLIVSVRHRNL